MLTPDQIKAIRERAEKATEGPWSDDICEFADCQAIRFADTYLFIEDDQQNIFKDCQDTGCDACGCYAECLAGQRDDLRFIAHSRQDIPALLAHIEELEAKLAKWESPRTFTMQSTLSTSPTNDKH